MNTRQAAFPDLNDMVQLFYERPEELGQFEHVRGAQVPEVYRGLLDHDQHMTVTLESHHETPVDVRVLTYEIDNDVYLRDSLLTKQSDGRAVQYGIVRLHMHFLGSEVRSEIESRRVPLGRALINHNVLRRVELGQLWRVMPGANLCRHFQLTAPQVTYGRTAIIHCHDEPAVELLEIVAPEPL